MPASLAALFVVVALVPGYVWLSLTTRHRRANHNPTQAEELLTLVAVGLLIAGPLASIATLIADETVVDLLSTPADEIDEDLLRRGTTFGLSVIAASTAASVLSALLYRHLNRVQSGEAGWHDAFSIAKSVYLDVTLSDGVTVRGLLYSSDGKSHGAGRDIVLKGPIVFVRDGQRPSTHDCSRFVISETRIHTIAVHSVPEDEAPSSS